MTDDESRSEEDPFENLDEAVGDREGDPFEHLASDAEEETLSAESSDKSAHLVDGEEKEQSTAHSQGETGIDSADDGNAPPDGVATDAFDEYGEFEEEPSRPEDKSTADGNGQPTEFQPEDPSNMRFDIGQRGDADPMDGLSPSEEAEREGDPFASVDSAFESMDVTQIDPDTVWQELTSAQSRGSVGDASKRTYADVSKHRYCEQCEHFSEPPEMSCMHEGTEIVEFLDMETVRVVDCPIVTERERLENEN